MTKRNPDLVSASDIASYSYCPEAWRLGQGLGLAAGNEEQRLRGERVHVQTAAVERHSTAALRVGFVLLALGVVALVASLFIAVGR